MVWQPIETAPKDGAAVLTFRKAGIQAVAMWTNNRSLSGPGWVVIDGEMIVGVTHWMPLPEPPKP